MTTVFLLSRGTVCRQKIVLLPCFLFQAEMDLGAIDMLVNCAGFAVAGKFEEIPIAMFKVLLLTKKYEVETHCSTILQKIPVESR